MYENVKLELPMLPIYYINGKYLTVSEFKYNNKIYPVGSILTKVNNEEVADIFTKLFPFHGYFPMKIDVNNHCFYSDEFWLADNLVEKGSLYFTFMLPDNSISNDTFYFNKSVDLIHNKAIFDNSKKVEYWADLKVLYIRIPFMSDSRKSMRFFRTKILENGKGKEINKVIIDIRNNGGGSCLMWKAIYQLLIKYPITLQYSVYGKNPKSLTKRYKKDHNINNNISDSINFKNVVFYRYDTDSSGFHFGTFHTIKPFKESLNLDCKIITIGNDYIFSAAGMALKIPNSNPNDNFISIGRPVGEFIGDLFDAIEFKLPNSKIKIEIDPSIDLQNVKEVKDAMHDRFEYEIPVTLKELQDKYNYNGNIWSKDFLINYDPFIKKALEL